MANHNDLKSDIRQYIYSNQNEEITGNILRDVLLEMVDTLGDGWTYKGVATTTTNPGTPDDNVFYIATAPGTYTNFGGLSVVDGEVAILKYNGSWAKEVTGAATAAQVTQLGQEVYIIAPEYFGEDAKQNGQYNTNGDTLVPSATTAVKQIIDTTARAGDVYALIGQGAFSYNLWAFADADGNILSRSGGNVNALVPIRIVAPTGTTMAVFSSYYASGEKFAVLKNAIFDKDHYILDPLPGKVADNEQAIAQITDAIAVRAWVKKDTSSGPYKPTNQNTGNNGARLSGGTIYAASSSSALVTDLIEIDHAKRYKLKTVIANYFQGIAYYNNGTYIGNDIFHTTGAEQTIEAELTIPENATHFRLATAAINVAYEISTYETLYPQLATKESVDDLQEDVETLQANVADLYGIAEAAGTMDVARAVRYIPTKDIYLGADIVSLQGATYDPTYWSVTDGVVKYLGGGGQSTPFVFGMVTSNGQGYLAELTATVASPGFEDLFNIKIGDGALVDTYNGTANTMGGLVSDGGSFTIVPMSTKAFDLTSVKLSPVLASDESTGYQRTVTISVLNISAGNSAQTLIDGKWNVAVGPTEYTMAHNVGGSRSVAIGYMALNKWNNGLQNIAIGTFAASNIEEGKYNVCIGADSMWQVKKATGNVVIGRSALGKTGEYAEVLRNVAIGYRAMADQESGASDSVTIGHNSNLYGVSRSVFIGSDCTASYANRTISNVVCIGYGARATKSNQCVLGNTLVTEFVLGNKKLVFNNDNTVSWETIS